MDSRNPVKLPDTSETTTISAPATVVVASRAAIGGASLTPGTLLGGRYEIGGELGSGGAGTVYRAVDLGTQSTIAIKVLNPKTNPAGDDGIYRELRFGRSVQHPNVCRIFDVHEAEGHCFLTMEYAAGGTLRRALVGERSWQERVADAQAVIAGVAAIHRAGIVHRDLKPENVLRLHDGRLVVTDFGVARLPELTTISGPAGTPGYLAPELCLGAKASFASDVWALGGALA